MTTNIIESLNVMLIKERESPVTFIVNSIARRFGEKFRKSRVYVLNFKENKLVSAAKNITRDNMS